MEHRARIPVEPPISNPLSSYWHNPKSQLANLIEPETDAPKTPYDYAIIGSGISGAMIAYNLLRRFPSSRIIMLEAREICSGATGRNGGHTKAASYRSYMDHVQELGKEEALRIARMEYANIVATHQLARELEIECESVMCRTLDVIYDMETFERGKTAIEVLRGDAAEEERSKGKMAWYEVHERMEALKNDFWLAERNGNPTMKDAEDVVGVFEYMAGRIHAYRFTTGILQHCVRKGLQICTNTPVHAIRSSQKQKDPAKVLWDLQCSHTTLTAQTVVLATNGYTPYLLPWLQGAIVPMRGQITAQTPGSDSKLPALLPTTYSFIYREGYEYMIPRPLSNGEIIEGQHIVIGGGLGRLPESGASEYGTVDDSSLNLEISMYLQESLVGFFGEANWGESFTTPSTSSLSSQSPLKPQSKRIVQEWTGIMGATADGRPFVGSVAQKPGVWVIAGFNGHGMVLCLKSAEALVEMIEGGIEKRPEWFPRSFLISEKRVAESDFRGRRDI